MQLIINPKISHNKTAIPLSATGTADPKDILAYLTSYFSAISGPVPMRPDDLIEQISQLTCTGHRKVYGWDEMTKMSEMRFLQSCTPLQRPLVDVCCGYGYWISKTIAEIDLGVDLFPCQGRFARSLHGMADRHFIDNCYQTALQADITHPLPIPANSVATVTAICSLEHIPDYQAAITEIFRILQPGGRLLMTVDAPLLTEVLDEIFNSDYCQKFKKEHQLETLLNHDEWCTVLTRIGFKLERSTGYINRRHTALCLMAYFPSDFTSYWSQSGFSDLFVRDKTTREVWNKAILPVLTSETNPHNSMLIAIAAQKPPASKATT